MAKSAVDYQFITQRAKALTQGERYDLTATVLKDSSERLLARARATTSQLPGISVEELAGVHSVGKACVRRALQLVEEGLAVASADDASEGDAP